MWKIGCTSFRDTSAACHIYEPHTFLQFLLPIYVFVFTSRFFRLDLFLNTAIIFIFLKTRLIFECESNVAVSAAIMLLFDAVSIE